MHGTLGDKLRLLSKSNRLLKKLRPEAHPTKKRTNTKNLGCHRCVCVDKELLPFERDRKLESVACSARVEAWENFGGKITNVEQGARTDPEDLFAKNDDLFARGIYHLHEAYEYLGRCPVCNRGPTDGDEDNERVYGPDITGEAACGECKASAAANLARMRATGYNSDRVSEATSVETLLEVAYEELPRLFAPLGIGSDEDPTWHNLGDGKRWKRAHLWD